MKTQRAQRIKGILYKLVKGDALVLVAAFLLLVCLVIVKQNTGGLDWSELDPSQGLFEMIIIAVIGWLVVVVKRALLNYLEDDVKLTNDYENLVATYLPPDIKPEEASFVTFNNAESFDSNLALLKVKEFKLSAGTGRLGSLRQTIFPVVVEHLIKPTPVSELVVEDSTVMYELPIVIQANYKSILEAHQESHLYNQLVIRVRDWGYEAGKLSLRTERSSYFNSMVTNRAMDYDFGEITVRKLFEYGPRISPLSVSKLSNHLGFNAFLITEDGYVPFVKRGRGVSIGKGTFGDSIGASLKA